ncbi:amidohydrolase family protein [candidate division KSB1 bacterium]
MIKMYRVMIYLSIVFCMVTFNSAAAQENSNPVYDVLIKGGKVYDGSLNKEFSADVAVKDGKIVKVAKSIKGDAKRIIDAKKLYITPGFIDMHTHADRGMLYPESRASLNYLKQGVTTIVAGQCGSSAWPIYEQASDHIKRWTDEGIGLNAALLVGHGTVRRLVMGNENRAPTAEELDKMKILVKEAMEQGAYGLSTGLIYEPGRFSKTDEVIELVKEIVPYGGIYHSHIRNEWDNHIPAVKEAINIGKITGAPVHISHFKIMGVKNWGNINKACELIEEARAAGMKITADQYPYRFTNTTPYMSLIPRRTWLGSKEDEFLRNSDVAEVFDFMRDKQLISLYNKVEPDNNLSESFGEYLEQIPRKELVRLVARSIVNTGRLNGSSSAKARMLFLERLSIPDSAKSIKENVLKYVSDPVTPENIIIAICPVKDLEGKSLKEAAKILKKPVADTAIELYLMGTMAVPYRMSEEDTEYAMKKDWVASGSDGTTPFYGIGLPHIRSYTTFLHKIKKYAQERKTVSVAHVIRSQTSLPAQIMNWDDRGWIKEGYIADIAVIDMKNIKTGSSITDPHNYCSGVEYLLVNGEPVIEEGSWNGKLPGKVIKLKK